MTDNKRVAPRVGLVIDIKLTLDNEQEFLYKSRNISDTGVFLEHLEEPMSIAVGTQVVLQVCSMLDDEAPPPVKSEVTRLTDEGIGLRFIL